MKNLAKNNPILSKLTISKILPVFLLTSMTLSSLQINGMDKISSRSSSVGIGLAVVSLAAIAAYYAGASYIKYRYKDMRAQTRAETPATKIKRIVELAHAKAQAKLQTQEKLRLATPTKTQAQAIKLAELEKANTELRTDSQAEFCVATEKSLASPENSYSTISSTTVSHGTASDLKKTPKIIAQLEPDAQKLLEKLITAIDNNDYDLNLRSAVAQVTRILADYSTHTDINIADIYGLALIHTVKGIKNNNTEIEQCGTFEKSIIDVECIPDDADVTIAKLLIKAGANLEIETKYGETALRCTSALCAKLLVEAVLRANSDTPAAQSAIMDKLGNSENPYVRRVLTVYY